MIDMRDPRGIITFIVRYLMLQVGLLVLLVLSLSSSLVLLAFFCLMGFFTFFQVLASISRDFLDYAGLWKAIVIAVTVLIDVPILWWFGRLAAGIAGSGSDWWLVTSWMLSARGGSARSSTRRILGKLPCPAPLTVSPIRLKPKTSAIPKTQRQTPRRPPPRSLRPKRAPTPTTSSSLFCSGLNYPAVGRAHTPAPASSMRTARAKRTQKTQLFRILPTATLLDTFRKEQLAQSPHNDQSSSSRARNTGQILRNSTDPRIYLSALRDIFAQHDHIVG